MGVVSPSLFVPRVAFLLRRRKPTYRESLIITFVGTGAEWMWGGDACVALAGGDEGDAQHKASPAFTGRFIVMLLRKPLRTRRGGGWDDAGWGRLRRPRPAPESACFLLPGRRKRPHSTQLHSRPYGYDSSFPLNTYP